ncbi:MAG TPA: hypothetical protein VFM94_01155 [Solirubrobacterales bacterium]|nr:hypothetical protein [Solirubrobacterales bacterium]
MKLKSKRISPSMVIALIALFASLAGNAVAFQLGRNSVGARELANPVLRFGKLHDTDTTASDGQFREAKGHAACKRGELLLNGGVRLHAGGDVAPHAWEVESAPQRSKGRWRWNATLSSDLGGAARNDFVVVATCLPK